MRYYGEINKICHILLLSLSECVWANDGVVLDGAKQNQLDWQLFLPDKVIFNTLMAMLDPIGAEEPLTSAVEHTDQLLVVSDYCDNCPLP